LIPQFLRSDSSYLLPAFCFCVYFAEIRYLIWRPAHRVRCHWRRRLLRLRMLHQVFARAGGACSQSGVGHLRLVLYEAGSTASRERLAFILPALLVQTSCHHSRAGVADSYVVYKTRLKRYLQVLFLQQHRHGIRSYRPPRPRRGNAASDSAYPNSGINVGAGPGTAPAPGDQDADHFGAVAELGGAQDVAAVSTNLAPIKYIT
jgi:hypothetical protein